MKNALFALFGVGILISLALLFAREGNREWKRYQKTFRNMEIETIRGDLEKTGDENARRSLRKSLDTLEGSNAAIKQVYLRDFGIIDRCQTCHLGMTDQRRAKSPQPFTSHPGGMLDSHPVYKFGCAVCHQGQGLATTTRGGHGYEANWTDPLLALDYIEASCIQCHSDLAFRDAPLPARGEYLIKRLGCLGCHEAEKFMAGEKIGAVLDPVGRKTGPNWVATFLKVPGEYAEETRMPNFRFAEDDIRLVQDYLFSLDHEAQGEARGKKTQEKRSMEDPSHSSEAPKKGRRLVEDSGCMTCHRITGMEEPGFFRSDKIGPELSRVGSKLDEGWLRGFLGKPVAYQPGSRMPTFRLSAGDIKALTRFLLTLKWENRDLLESGRKASSTNRERMDAGKRLITRYNCVGCHEVQGVEKGEKGPAWDGIGSRPLSKFDFGENPDHIEKTRLAWIRAKILKPRSFRDSLKMPFLRISEEDAAAITTTLLGLTDRPIPEEYLMGEPDGGGAPDRIPLEGAAGTLWQELKCLQCHPVGGTGGNVGPELAFEGTRVQPEWLKAYLMKPRLIRPISADRMPDLGLKEKEAGILSLFTELALVDNRIRAGPIQEGRSGKKRIRRGKKLFSRKYGCLGCHQVKGKGGRIGPDLSTLGTRLNGDWVYAYLENPQSAIPDAMMPNFGLADDENRDLTAYLLTLRPEDTRDAGASTHDKDNGSRVDRQ